MSGLCLPAKGCECAQRSFVISHCVADPLGDLLLIGSNQTGVTGPIQYCLPPIYNDAGSFLKILSGKQHVLSMHAHGLSPQMHIGAGCRCLVADLLVLVSNLEKVGWWVVDSIAMALLTVPCRLSITPRNCQSTLMSVDGAAHLVSSCQEQLHLSTAYQRLILEKA